jgi:glucose-1-phosphate cytidylyltransferase
MKRGGRQLLLENSDIQEWEITFVDTGLKSNIGERLNAVRPYLGDDDHFLANYSEGLTDLDFRRYWEWFQASGKTAAFLCVKPSQTFHVVSLNRDATVHSIEPVQNTDLTINGGYFIFRKDVFDYIRPGEELVREPFQRLMDKGQLLGYRYDRFWCMDTFKEHQELTDLYAQGEVPWEVWKHVRP